MPTPAVTLRLRRFRRRFGMTAPRVSVRTHVAWYWYALALLVLIAGVAAVVWWLAKQGEVSLMENEVLGLRSQVQSQDAEIIRLRLLTGTEQSAVQVERTAQQQLLSRLKQLEQENALLKEDMALFERLVPADVAESTLRIERLGLLAEPESGKYRYRLLLRFQPGKQEKEFRGRLQLTLTYLLAGKEALINFPAGKEAPGEYMIDVRNFLRKEGMISLPAGARVKRIEARVLQGGTVRATLQTNL
ncbi:MAG TPA: hypothetical protein PLW86_10045 [Rhodocyclaceae bacterium]|nr:hypothetical protein [Rhodocyclaceae bacterium]